LSRNDRIGVFEHVWKQIDDRFYDPQFNGVDWRAVHDRYAPLVSTVASDTAFYNLMSAMARELHDAHTRVFSPEQVALRRKQQRVTLGISVREIDGVARVTGILPESEAARAGITPGMSIAAIDGEPMARRLPEAEKTVGFVSSVRSTRNAALGMAIGTGSPGSTVALTLQRPDGSSLEATIHRQRVAAAPRVMSRRLSSGFAYIRFTQFVAPAAKQVNEALDALRDTPGLILDIRANGGGDQEELESIAGSFFNEETAFVRDSTRSGHPYSVFHGFGRLPFVLSVGEARDQVYAGPVVVLVDGFSASTSEMFASGMQETGRAVIVGTQTCGCVVGIHGQETLKGGGALTIAEVPWFTVKGRRLEGEGVIPDREVPVTLADIVAERDAQLEEAERILAVRSRAK
jgi:C-terminal peptidase prc